jgi:hypothetical protein
MNAEVVAFPAVVGFQLLTMHGPINVKSPNNTIKWQMGFNSAFKGLILSLGIPAVLQVS